MLKDLILDNLKNSDLKYSVYVKNLHSGECCFINEKQIVPSASIIKLFVMAAVINEVENKALSLNQRVGINKEEKVLYGIISLLDDENTYTLKDLLMLMIIESDNTATNKLIDMLGMDKINNFIKSMNFQSTILQRKMMDFEAQKIGKENMTNANDVGIFFELLYNRKIISKDSSELMNKILLEQKDNAMMRINLDDSLHIAHKTGDLDRLKHDAGIVYEKDQDYIFIMFTWEAASDNYARNIIGSISKITYDYFISDSKRK